MSIRSGLSCFSLCSLGERELDALLGVSGRAFIVLTWSSTSRALGRNNWVLWGHQRWFWDHTADEMKVMGTLVSFALIVTVRTHFWVLVPFCLKSFHPAFLIFFFLPLLCPCSLFFFFSLTLSLLFPCRKPLTLFLGVFLRILSCPSALLSISLSSSCKTIPLSLDWICYLFLVEMRINREY